ncbi:hypothetical protein EXE59_03160 [Nocardioides eburneiflavus]|uniref:DUF4386 family protein n=1 Tax=Nocardioides eburneiflavus TaxID=2518372 RepID=A0A4Z1C6V3_9ACTN|nr:hypothetical protein [Nocardioides eburneiflavus]TGN63056.1 hypothetical protein EXE59_03160 [Nocardioides eburneiflavus]
MTRLTSTTRPSASTTTAPTTTAPTAVTPAPTSTSAALIRTAGVAAQVVAGTYVIGFLAMVAYLVPRGFTSPVDDPAASLGFLRDHQGELGAWYFVLYLLGGAAMALVSLGVAQRLAPAPALARVSAALGLIWSGLLIASGSIALVGQHAAVTLHAQDPDLALTTWVSTSVIQDALGGGIEVAGALWAAAVGVAVLRSRALSAPLGGLALGLAAVGMATVVPAAADAATSIFGLGLIVWFTWLGLALRRR